MGQRSGTDKSRRLGITRRYDMANGGTNAEEHKKRSSLDLSLDSVQKQGTLTQEQTQTDQQQLNASVQAYTEQMAREHADAQVTVISQNATLTIMSDLGMVTPAETVQAPAKNISMLRKISSGLPVIIPGSAAEPIAEYHFYEQKVSSMWRSSRKSPDKVADRMSRHIERFMCSDEITETDVAKMTTTVLSSSEILKQNARAGSSAEKMMEVLRKLENDTEGAAVAEILEKNRDLLKDPTDKRLPWDDPYHKQHPAAARVLIMQNILQNVKRSEFNVSGFRAESKLDERIDGMIANLAPLCELIQNSEEYATALKNFAGVSPQYKENSLTGEFKVMFEKGLTERIKRLDHAMGRWGEITRKLDSETTEEILRKYLMTLELNEQDMKLFKELPGAEHDLITRVTRYANELERLRVYFREDTTPEQKLQIERSLGMVSTRKKKKDVFYGTKLRPMLGKFGIKRDKPDPSPEKDSEAESTYPPEVVENVHMIDQWFSAHMMDTKDSDTESNFSAELLQKPFSQRLFAYYLLENKKRKQPSMSCVMLALNGYVPNLKKIRKVMMASKGKFWIRMAEAAKGNETVQHTKIARRALGQTGHVYLKKVEDTLRILDDKEKNYVEKIESARKERQAHLAEQDQLIQKRHDQSIECVRIFEEYRVSIDKHKRWRNVVTKKKQDEMQRKSQDAFEALSTINSQIRDKYQQKHDADRAAKNLAAEALTDEALKQKIIADGHHEGFTEEELKVEQEREHMSVHDKIDTSIEIEGKVVDYADKINGIAGDYSSDTSGIQIWPLEIDQLGDIVLTKAVFGASNAVLQLAEVISSFCSIPSEISEGGGAGAVEIIADGIEKLAEVASTLTTSIETFRNAEDITHEAWWKMKDSVDDLAGDITSVKIVSTVSDGAVAVNSVRKIVTTSVNAGLQIDGEEAAQKLYYQKLQGVKEGSAEETKLKEESRKLANIRKMQHKANKRRVEQATVKLITSSLGIVGTWVPGADAVIAPLTTIISIGASVKEFYDKINEADSAIDDYIHMDELLKEYKEQFRKPDGSIDEDELQAMADEVLSVRTHARRDEVFKDEIREAVLRELGFSSYAAMADSVAEDYCQTVHDLIFKNDLGDPIYEGDPGADLNTEMNQALIKMFSPLTFKYPVKADPNNPGSKEKPGKPTIDKMKETLLK